MPTSRAALPSYINLLEKGWTIGLTNCFIYVSDALVIFASAALVIIAFFSIKINVRVWNT